MRAYMFNPTNLLEQSITISQIAAITERAEFLVTVKDQLVELDTNTVRLDRAVLFQNCRFVVAPDLKVSTIVIFAKEAVRIEDSRIEAGLCIKGELRNENTLAHLGQVGPNVFIENCEFAEFETNVFDRRRVMGPSVQISGTVNHCRIMCQDPVEVAFMQCRFWLLEITGTCAQFQISETLGRELMIYRLDAMSLWFQRDLTRECQQVDVDAETIANLGKRIGSQDQIDLIEALRMFMRIFKRNGNNRLFLDCNAILCRAFRYRKPNQIQNFVVYGLFKNFYSTSSMLWFSFAIVSLFGCVYFGLDETQANKRTLWDWMYFSAITFTTVGYGDLAPTGIMRILAPIEAFLGVLSVIFTSWVVSRQYNDY
ncbi:MAG: two pore domain potassium channel family protein [Leptospirales bacterium]|nr:two pore domain potassium channel family protein [Leptospirales bacterium]